MRGWMKEENTMTPASLELTDTKNLSAVNEFKPYVNGKQMTGSDGTYMFENLPIMDENGNPYQYRIRMKKPNHMDFTKLHELQENTEQHMNVYGKLAQAQNENEGATQSIELVYRRDKVNYYGHQFMADAKVFTYMDIALKQKNEKKTPIDSINTAAEALRPYGWLLAGTLSFGIILLLRRKRKEME